MGSNFYIQKKSSWANTRHKKVTRMQPTKNPFYPHKKLIEFLNATYAIV